MQTVATPLVWGTFALLVVAALVIDLALMGRRGERAVDVKTAVAWSVAWIALAAAFGAGLWLWLDGAAGREIANEKAAEYFTGYLIEKSLSVDNIFVFLMLFTYFAVPPERQRRVLAYGVIGAVVLRIVMILIGAWLISRFHGILYVFGAFLLATGIKMIVFADEKPDLAANPVLRWMRGRLSLTDGFEGERFWVVRDGRRWYTPLFLVLVLIGVTDVVFAVDSIPAIFAITEDPFIVMAANVFAVLGLRALYFVVADLAHRFHYLSYGLGAILVFVGTKMLVAGFWKVPVGVS
ncbi:MAG TPA: TerC/Alx family metal homeostasis membrane protein, partial [Usitatibacteraceae bacterium]|nr:TerC/Alx family metal homeostasis membrane protein [Usitatibacteraceae bacterium]